jgi:RNA polymerase sigma-70 factor (ECF subfamily)
VRVPPEADLMRVLHDEHASALWSYAMRLTSGDRGRAEDAVQETMLRAWRHPEVLDSSRGSPRGWLFTTLRHVVIDEWRARSVRPEKVTDRVPEVSVPDAADTAVQSWLVADALRQLSPSHREVLVECFYRGMSVAEAAARLGVPPGTVKSRTHYALRALKLALEEMGVTA